MTSTEGYSEDEMLMLSGIEHFIFCPRQWALIHIENLWNDNRLTAEGSILHTNVDNPFQRQTNGSATITLRGLRISSSKLGLSGIADAVEITPFQDAPTKRKELFSSKMFDVLPIEYKRGKSKISDCERVQVAAQAMILEEMLGVAIPYGAIFHWEERHRERFRIDDKLRYTVFNLSQEMHRLFENRITPNAQKSKACKSCSLFELCLPNLSVKDARLYNKSILDDNNEL